MSLHTRDELKLLQALPLDLKIRKTQQRIREWYDHWNGQVCVSFSGGKDSTVLLHLVRGLYPEVPAVFVDTGLEYPEIREHVRCFENVEWLHPKMDFRSILLKYGYPFPTKEVAQKIYEMKHCNLTAERRKYLLGETLYNGKRGRYAIPKRDIPLLSAPFEVSKVCCDIMKKRPMHIYERKTGRKPFVGTMTEESMLRETSWLRKGCNAFESKAPHSNPLSFWTEQDILTYIHSENLKLADVYGAVVENECGKLCTTGARRTGCIYCCFGIYQDKGARFKLLKEKHPKLFEYCMRPLEQGGLGIKTVLDFARIEMYS